MDYKGGASWELGDVGAACPGDRVSVGQRRVRLSRSSCSPGGLAKGCIAGDEEREASGVSSAVRA